MGVCFLFFVLCFSEVVSRGFSIDPESRKQSTKHKAQSTTNADSGTRTVQGEYLRVSPLCDRTAEEIVVVEEERSWIRKNSGGRGVDAGGSELLRVQRQAD
jgi:hypothetical protein